jgi:hypothetical protein
MSGEERSDVFTLTNLAEALLTRASRRIKSQCTKPDTVRLEFGFLLNSTLNAYASTRNGIDLIGINLDVPLLLSDLFNAMLSTPDILPGIGDPSKEKGRPEDYDPLSRTLDLNLWKGPRFVPTDPTRRGVALDLSVRAVAFIFQHEFAHIFNGHIDLIQNLSGIDVYAEISDGPIWGLDTDDRQTLEWDADSFAMVDCLSTIGSLERTDPSKQKRELFEWAFATYALFRIFASAEDVVGTARAMRRSHPPALIRAWSLNWLVTDVHKHVDFFSKGRR